MTEYREVAIRFHGITDSVPGVGKGSRKISVSSFYIVPTIDIGWGAKAVRNLV
tara:strand:+ start:14227 stop:14385 length:159 start_codon:yes stop_codon:yes gene_type:complete